MNIVILNANLPIQLRLDVIPMDRPVFPRAEADSKRIARKDAFSVVAISKRSRIMMPANRKNMEKDFRTVSSGILCLKKLASL